MRDASHTVKQATIKKFCMWYKKVDVQTKEMWEWKWTLYELETAQENNLSILTQSVTKIHEYWSILLVMNNPIAITASAFKENISHQDNTSLSLSIQMHISLKGSGKLTWNIPRFALVEVNFDHERAFTTCILVYQVITDEFFISRMKPEPWR